MFILRLTLVTVVIALASAGYHHYGDAEEHYGHAAANHGAAGYEAQGHHGIEGYEQQHHHYVDYHTHPKYTFDYGVKDTHTGDHKSQWESRDGDHVKGGYTLDESDGTKRVVEYHSDKHGGFHAYVKRIGHADHPVQHYGGEHEGHHSHGHASSYANIHQHH